MAQWGASTADLPDWARERVEAQEAVIWPEDQPVVEVFAASATQWRIGPLGPVGLDYGAVRWIMQLHSLNATRELLEALQVMERAAIEWFTEGR